MTTPSPQHGNKGRVYRKLTAALTLSKHEAEVARLLDMGFSGPHIARVLGVLPPAVYRTLEYIENKRSLQRLRAELDRPPSPTSLRNARRPEAADFSTRDTRKLADRCDTYGVPYRNQ